MGTGTIVAIFTAHTIICIAYLLIFSRNKKMLALFPVVLCLPLLGIAALLLIYVLSQASGKQKKYETEGVFKETPHMEYIAEFNEEKERNVVPVEEALLLNEKEIQRSLVMEVAKRDPEGYLSKLKRALLSDDTETAHYAASSITELKRGYDKRLSDAERAYKRNPASGPSRREYIDVLNDILRADLTIEKIRNRYINMLNEVLEYDIEVSDKPAQDSFDMLITYLSKLEKYSEAEKWLQRYQNTYPHSDRPLRLKLLLAYETKDNDGFKAAIKEVEAAEFPITKKTLDMIDFWRGDAFNGHEAI